MSVTPDQVIADINSLPWLNNFGLITGPELQTILLEIVALYTNPSEAAAGEDTQLQYNNEGVLGGATGLTWNEITGTLEIRDFLKVQNKITCGTIEFTNLPLSNPAVPGVVWLNSGILCVSVAP